ncbi:MAG TPA: hypothetical protein VKU60_10145 [Chloroflexota bacterium]|nr:hypothetical protein [Chloroflexota bacterium]
MAGIEIVTCVLPPDALAAALLAGAVPCEVEAAGLADDAGAGACVADPQAARIAAAASGTMNRGIPVGGFKSRKW